MFCETTSRPYRAVLRALPACWIPPKVLPIGSGLSVEKERAGFGVDGGAGCVVAPDGVPDAGERVADGLRAVLEQPLVLLAGLLDLEGELAERPAVVVQHVVPDDRGERRQLGEVGVGADPEGAGQGGDVRREQHFTS